MTAPALRGSYPHPVLDMSDDVDSYFIVSNPGVSPSIEDIELTFEVRTDDPTLIRLLEERKARASLRWRCSATLATDEREPQTRLPLGDGSSMRPGLTTSRYAERSQRISVFSSSSRCAASAGNVSIPITAMRSSTFA